MLTALSRHFFYPLWDLWDGSVRLSRYRELRRTQWLAREELERRQLLRLSGMLQYAAKHSPYYRERFAALGITAEDLRDNNIRDKLPIITKRDIRGRLADFQSEEFDKKELVSAKTGGSTGAALQVFQDKRCQELRNGATLRSDEWAGFTPGKPRGALWGSPPQPRTFKQKLRHWFHDRMFYLDTMEMSEARMLAFIDAWRRAGGRILYGHAHSLFLLAEFVLEREVRSVRPDGIIATSMMLLNHERAVIERAFACPVTDRYGCEELGLIASQCERRGEMHMNIDDLYIEFLKDSGEPAGPGEQGRLVITDLNNHGMPLIRYEVGDVAVPSEAECPCGRGLPLMKKLVGRVADFLVHANGSRVAGISLIERTLTAISGIDQMQIVQEKLENFTVNVVRGKNYTKKTREALRSELTQVFGESTKFTFRYVTTIPQESSGKYRFSICKVKCPTRT